ncbi:DUF4190 domain-containing protein [Streptosporangium subroseum]|uniref:DUF4190 domain-containing protein n=1 Tax=Streptosporangium subroseum TaxID=106412 RepID=UPI00342577DE
MGVRVYDQHSSGYQQPYGYGQGGYPTYAPPPVAPRTSGLAVASLVFGILWICGVGSFVAIICGHMAISNIRTTRAGGKGLAVAGLVLGYLGIASISLFFIISAAGPGSTGSDSAAVATEAGSSEDGGAEDEPVPAPSPKKPVFKAEDYKQLSTRGFAKLTKDPDAYAGEHFILYGEVTQFDAATGTDGFLADTGPTKQQSAYGIVNFGQNAAYVGSKSRLADVVEDDLFQAYVTVVDSYSYETQIGGNTTVPRFKVDRIKVYGSTK